MTKKEATANRNFSILHELKTYNGSPCKNCGTTEKYTSGYNCLKCHLPSEFTENFLNKQKITEIRKKATENNELVYEGNPCKNCGGTTKRIANYACVICSKEKSKLRDPEKRKIYYLNNKDKYNENSKLNYFKNKDRDRLRNKRNYYKRNYNLTIEQYEEMVKQQNGLCYICKQLPSSGRNKILVVDHDHETGENRMLLCDQCNRLVGYLHEDPYYTIQLLNYIEFYNMKKQIKVVK